MNNLDRYLFRGISVGTGEWVYGYVFFDEKGTAFIIEKIPPILEERCHSSFCNCNGAMFPDYVNVIPASVGQWTGLTDKAGEKIFEYDKFKDRFGGRGVKTVKIEIEVSTQNEGNLYPWWVIVSPIRGFANIGDTLESICGPFFSRESAEAVLRQNAHHFKKGSKVFCLFGNKHGLPTEYSEKLKEVGYVEACAESRNKKKEGGA